MQFCLYLIVGGLSFFVDIGAFIVLRAIEVPVIPASVMCFSLATAANYLLCVVPLLLHPTTAKFAVPIVLMWHYFGRRLLVFSNEIPVALGSRLKPLYTGIR
jgi:hypothetical protein